MARFLKSQLAAYVLAGGKSTRMGHDKAFLAFQGQTLLERSLTKARAVTDHVYIVGSRSEFSSYAPVIEDIFPNRGPLGGIHAALASSEADLNLVLAVDMPFVVPEFFTYLADRACATAAWVTLGRTADGLQPLCAIYRRSFGFLAEVALKKGKNKIDHLFTGI